VLENGIRSAKIDGSRRKPDENEAETSADVEGKWEGFERKKRPRAKKKKKVG
jgi:hypothetical protein